MVKTAFQHYKKAVLEGTADALDDNGKGIVRTKEYGTLFVSNLLPGEKGKIETYLDKNGQGKQSVLLERLSNSPDRVKPLCPYYEECGGCSLMHLSYEKQLEYKRKKVQNLLHKFARIDGVEVNPTLGMEHPYRFRNKVQVPVKKMRGKLVTGFYAENSHTLIPSEDCLIESEKSAEILTYLKSVFTKYGVEAYDEDTGRGFLRHILIKESYHYPEIMVVFVTASREYVGKKNLVSLLTKKFPEIKTIVQNVNPRHTNVILGEQEYVWYGNGKIKDSIFGKDFLISSKSFYQTNPKQLEVLYSKGIEAAHLSGSETVLDAYSGAGTIGLSLASYAKHVTLVEIVKDAVKDGILNAKLNHIDNADFVCADCTDWILKNRENLHFDAVMMDPPRAGSTREFIGAVKSIAPKKVVYISCNPVTLARDLNEFKDAYEIESVTPVDMFPHTAHVETVVSMSRK